MNPAQETKPKMAVEEKNKISPFEIQTITVDNNQSCLVFVGNLSPTESASGAAGPIQVFYESEEKAMDAKLVQLLSGKDTTDK